MKKDFWVILTQDVLLHAVMDALLGAAASAISASTSRIRTRDIKGISSIALLKEVGKILQENGYMIENIDSTVIAQRPKLLPYRPQMAENIAAALGIEKEQVSVKATTEEGLGFTGIRRGDLRSGDRPFKFGGGLRCRRTALESFPADAGAVRAVDSSNK